MVRPSYVMFQELMLKKEKFGELNEADSQLLAELAIRYEGKE